MLDHGRRLHVWSVSTKTGDVGHMNSFQWIITVNTITSPTERRGGGYRTDISMPNFEFHWNYVGGRFQNGKCVQHSPPTICS